MSPANFLRHRLTLWQNAHNNPTLQATLLQRCQNDPVFWINTFCWTFDPRLPQPVLPFQLYPFQEHAVQELVRAIEHSHDMVIEKSRDMGASWLVMLVLQWFWLFHPGSNVHVGSRRAHEVDRGYTDPSATLFGKFRFNLAHLPYWMRPKGFQSNVHSRKLAIENPVLGNWLTGESATGAFSRGGRYRCIVFDEFAFFPDADLAWTAASQATQCRIAVSTPYGEHNQYAKLALGKCGDITKLRLHWRAHPLKTEAWYTAQQARMTRDEVARELDICYQFSVPEAVFQPEFQPAVHCLKQRYTVTAQQPIVRSVDYGRVNACLWAQQQDDKTWVVFQELVLSNSSTHAQGQRIQELSNAWPNARYIDVGDPAGEALDHRSNGTDTEILARYGIFPKCTVSRHLRNRRHAGIELLKLRFHERKAEKPMIQIDPMGCPILVQALQSAYRYRTDATGAILHDAPVIEEHPFEDVVDCLRYLALEMIGDSTDNTVRALPWQQSTVSEGFTPYLGF